MPKQKITREMILDAAFALAREGGMERVLVKEIAAQLGCSVQPIYFYFQNMEQLKSEIIQLAGTFLSCSIFWKIGRASCRERV